MEYFTSPASASQLGLFDQQRKCSRKKMRIHPDIIILCFLRIISIILSARVISNNAVPDNLLKSRRTIRQRKKTSSWNHQTIHKSREDGGTRMCSCINQNCIEICIRSKFKFAFNRKFFGNFGFSPRHSAPPLYR